MANDAWKKSQFWVYPETDRLGFLTSSDNRIEKIQPGFSAEKTGLKVGDKIEMVNGQRLFGEGDLRNALHHVGPVGSLEMEVNRTEGKKRLTLSLPPGWRETDLSWRWSMRSVAPGSATHGSDLESEDRKKLGLDSKQLAFRHGNYLSTAAQRAGIHIGDIIFGVDYRSLKMTQKQFDIFIRLNYRPGDVVHYNILRGQERLKIPVKLNDP